jgi:hypothetical protein
VVKLKKHSKLLILFVSLVIITGTALVSQAASQTVTKLNYRGTTSLGTQTAGDGNASGGTALEIHADADRVVNRLIPNSGLSAAHVPANRVPTPRGNTLAGTNPGFSGFNGISHRDQRLAGTGVYTNTQFSLEPPDQALSVGNGFVLEAVNGALAVYDTSGTELTGPVPINQFFNLAPEINRTTLVYGDFTSDPKSYYDPDTDRWFLTILQIDTNSSTGEFGPRTHVELAVSQTSDPTGAWNLFSLDTTDDGSNGTPLHPNCPCIGDQPLIGADANGFYISTNEYGLATLDIYNGAQVYAISKTALAAGVQPTVVQIDTGTIATPDAGGIWYSLQPSTTAHGDTYAPKTEYFLSTLNFGATNIAGMPSPGLDDRIAVWALTGTDTLSSVTPSLSLEPVVIDSEIYGVPPNAQQKDGTLPLAQVYIPQLYGGKTPPTEKLELLASNDDRMNQVVFAEGKLWSAFNTVIKTKNGPTRVGIAYFIIAPSVSGGDLSASVINQGYVAVNQNNVMYPSIGVNAAGKGVMTFTLVGPDFYPSAAYSQIDAVNGAGDVHIAGAGASPEDGFSGYHFFGSESRISRWGDYSAATADGEGNIWMAAEYIPNTPRTVLANWGTFVSKVTP